MDEYFLPPHVHCCRRGDAFVFLDLKQDDYILVTGAAADELRALMDTSLRAAAAAPNDPLAELEQGGLLTKDRAVGRPFATTDVDRALEPLLDFDTAPPTTIRIVDCWHFIAACLTAVTRLRWSRLEDTVTGVAKRKALHAPYDAVDQDRVRHLTVVFQRLRRFFPTNYLCLFDSLALIEFLARYEVFPTWVFAVRLEPWAAHCWLQQGQFTFNEGAEDAAGYTPIMAI